MGDEDQTSCAEKRQVKNVDFSETQVYNRELTQYTLIKQRPFWIKNEAGRA